MTLFELLDKNMDAILAMGDHAIAAAKRDGVPAHYMDPSLGPRIIRELPDGSRERLESSPAGPFRPHTIEEKRSP